MLGASWEHMPAIDPILIRSRMLFLQNEIRSLENRKRALLEEEQELIVRAVTLGDRDPLRRLEEINQRLALSFFVFCNRARHLLIYDELWLSFFSTELRKFIPLFPSTRLFLGLVCGCVEVNVLEMQNCLFTAL